MDGEGVEGEAGGGPQGAWPLLPRRRHDVERAPPVGPHGADWGGGEVATRRPTRRGAVLFEARELPLSLPMRRRRPSRIAIAWFLLAFVAPVLAGVAYFGAIASDQYVTEYRFTVREPEGAATDAAAVGGMSAILGVGASSGALHNHTVVDYATSGQAARDLQQTLDLRRMFSRTGVDDLSRFDAEGSDEALARFWRRQVFASFDPATGLALVRVRAFSPADSRQIADALIERSETLVNGIGRRSRADSATFTEQEVQRAERELASLRGAMTGLRTSTGVIDPETSTVAGNATLSNTLRARLSDLEGQLAAVSAEVSDPTAPQVVQLRSRIDATRVQLTEVESAPSERGGLSATVGRFEQLKVQTQAAEQALLAARANLQRAVTASDAERLYMVVYVRPSTPDAPGYPDRLESIGLVMLVSFLIWLVGVLIGRSVLEHAT